MLEERVPGLSIELVEIRTSGDRIQAVPLGPELGQSFFTKEIEQALLDDRIDLAVHSCKDLATTLPDVRISTSSMDRPGTRSSSMRTICPD
jgi:hydroxymethylbilane synthase